MISSRNLTEITSAVADLLSAASTIGAEGVGVERSAELPIDPPANGWVGVFRTGMSFPNRVLGAGNAGRTHRIDLMLALVQTGSTGEDCEDRINELAKDVIDVLLEDGSFGGTVDAIDDSVEVHFNDYSKSDTDSQFRQVGYVFLTGLKNI